MLYVNTSCDTVAPHRRNTRSAAVHLRLEEVTHRYGRHASPVLDAVSLGVPRGEIAVVLGLSGSGKSTLLQIMGALIAPAAGRVLLAGKHYRRPTSRCVLLYQEPLLFPWMTVRDNIALAARYAGAPQEEADRKISLLASMTGLSQLLDAEAQRISGGQQQRVALARALAADPEILLLDEPFSSLDPFIRRRLQKEVRRISKTLGLTVVLVTHDIDEAVALADRVLILSHHTRRIESELPIPESWDREPGSRGFAQLRADLIARFESVAGSALEHDPEDSVEYSA